MTKTAFPQCWLEHRVSYGETDTMGVLYYAEYLHIFERGRTELIRSLGITYREVEERGIYLPVRSASCRYKSPVRYDDLLQLLIGIKKLGLASITFEYSLYDAAKEKVHATGETEHAFINKTGKPVPVPDWFRVLYTTDA